MRLYFKFGFVTTVLFMLLTLMNVNAVASGFRVVSEQYAVNSATHICVVEVLEVNKKENVQVFNDGTSRRVSSGVKMLVRPIESLKGGCGNEPFTTTYTTPITATFDDNGHVEKRYTILKLDTGLELGVKVGQQYIVSYLSWSKNTHAQTHQRINALKDKTHLLSLLSNETSLQSL